MNKYSCSYLFHVNKNHFFCNNVHYLFVQVANRPGTSKPLPASAPAPVPLNVATIITRILQKHKYFVLTERFKQNEFHSKKTQT